MIKKDFSEIDVIYVCIGFSGHKMNSDKNFYLDLFEKLTQEGLKIVVISFSDPLQCAYTIDEESLTYPIIHLSRPFHFGHKTKFWTLQGKTLVYNHHHNVFWDHIERYISLLYWNSYISSIITKSKPKYIHYLDPFIGTFDYTGTKKIITQTRVDNKYPFFYKIYLYLVFKNADTGIFFNKEQISYLPKKIAHKIKSHIIPWGKDINKQIINRKNCIKTEGNILFLWSGYIQQIRYDDFIKAKKLAEKAVTHYKNIAFVFAFKTAVKIDLPKSSDRIRYLKPGNEFKALVDSADVFFSPLCSRDSVIGPPLTWIEFIADRKPILTTNVKGLGNYFEKDSSILTFNDDEEFLTIIEGISNKNINLSLIGQNAYNVFKMHFDLKNITEKYLNIYNS